MIAQGFLYEQSIVTIHQAQRTESKKSDDGHDLIVFSGDVYLTIEKDNILITISADKVNFDRERDMLYAADNITMTENNGDDFNRTLKGNSLLMNTSSLEGVFDDVLLTQKQANSRNLSAETTMIVSSEVFSRDNGGTIVFKKARLTFCDDENPHWQLRSSRLWLLPGSEFAFLNAVLYVGRVPVLYMPFFYYPKDEMIFNPSFGYRPRVGYFTQTTTYLIGRKPLPEESGEDDGLFNFAHPSQLMEQRREGLFLRNLDTPLSDYSNDYLKVLADVYSNLGAMMGIQGDFAPKDSYFKRITFSDLFGVSRNLYKLEDNALYSPKNEYGVSEWNKSMVFGKKLPFRFAAGLEAQGSSDHTTFNISLPFYS
ncbi:MAG: LPS-assembly protein LptD, partial [Spirochaetaceae bacterium]|nr:LPS-assembly protein LptD [Spirochaetaceae bacterium]